MNDLCPPPCSLFRPVTRLVVLVAALVLLPLSAPAAQAARLRVADPRGDMVKVEEGGGNPQPAPGATIGDVVRSSFRHSAHRVIVRVRFADLARKGRRLTLWVDLRDETGRLRTLGVEATRHDRNGHTILMTRRGKDIRCAVRHRISYREDFIRAAVPRRCLGGPETVSFRVLTEHVRSSWAYAWLDNGLSENLDDRRWTAPVARG